MKDQEPNLPRLKYGRTQEQKTQTVKRVIYRADGKGTEKLKAVEVEIGAHEKIPILSF